MAEAEEHSKMYKNVGKGEQEASRKKRTETTIQLRREKRGNELNKRRNIDENAEYESEVSDYEKDKGFQCTFPQARQILMENPSLEDLRNVFQYLRRQLSKPQNAPINELVQEGLVQALVQGLAVEDIKVQYEAAWALTNVVSGDASHTQTAVKCGATQAFIKAAYTTDLSLAEQCFWGLANIIGDCAELRNHAIECGFLEIFGKIINERLNEMKTSFVRTLAWCCTNLCRHKNPQLKDEYVSFILPIIKIFLLSKDNAAKIDACWSLSYLTDSTEEILDMTYEAGLLPAVRPLLNPKSNEMLAPSIRVYGNFASGSDIHTQRVLEMGIIAKEIPAILQQAPTKIVKEIMWLVSNVLAGTPDQIQAVIDAEVMPHVLHALRVGDFRVQTEAIWSVSNLCHSGTPEQIYYLASLRIFDFIVPLCQIRSAEFITHILSVIKGVFHAISVLHPEHLEDFKQSFEEIGGIDAVEELQNHENAGIYDLAFEIINTYFQDEDDGENVNPEAKVGGGGDNATQQPVFRF